MAMPAGSPESLSAIILSAGLSERMGSFKPLMPLGDRTVLQRALDLFAAAGIPDIIVVTGNRAAEVQKALAGSGARGVENTAFRDGMFTSVVAGIKALPPQCRGFFVLPVDISLVRPATVKRLMAAYTHHADKQIFYPVYSADRGHPPLIAAGLGPDIVKWPGTGGLRGLLDLRDSDAMDVPVADEGILFDLDTPEDHRHLLVRLARGRLPTEGECREMLTRLYSLPDAIARHCDVVADVAAALHQAVQQRHSDLDGELIRAAAMLHDIARLEPSHAQTGARWIETEGFPRVAHVVRQHMDLVEDPAGPLSEVQVVYLADKLVHGDVPMTLERRFRMQRAKMGSDLKAHAAMERRYGDAVQIRNKVEQAAGRALTTLLQAAGMALAGGA